MPTLHAVEVRIPHSAVQWHLGKIAATISEMTDEMTDETTDETTGERMNLTIAIPTTSH
jgi:hypothetical protein